MKKAAWLLACLMFLAVCPPAGATEFNLKDYTVFTFGERMIVYQAPDEAYHRDGNAAVGISNKARLYGTMGEWLLIGYGYSTDRFRVGWVRTPAPEKDKRTVLSESDTVGELRFDMVVRRTNDECAATYDPVKVSTRNVELKKGALVTVLCWYDKWAYVEMRIDKKPSWGFIYAKMLESEPVAKPAPALSATGTGMDRVLKEVATRTPGGHLGLFSGPAESYLRADEGRAHICPEDKCHIYGSEGDWVFVRAGGESGVQYGYIPEASLSDKSKIKALAFDCTPAVLTQPAALLDAPDEDARTLTEAGAGAQLIFLAWSDSSRSWAYVEYRTESAAARGFVPAGIIRKSAPQESATLP